MTFLIETVVSVGEKQISFSESAFTTVLSLA